MGKLKFVIADVLPIKGGCHLRKCLRESTRNCAWSFEKLEFFVKLNLRSKIRNWHPGLIVWTPKQDHRDCLTRELLCSDFRHLENV